MELPLLLFGHANFYPDSHSSVNRESIGIEFPKTSTVLIYATGPIRSFRRGRYDWFDSMVHGIEFRAARNFAFFTFTLGAGVTPAARRAGDYYFLVRLPDVSITPSPNRSAW
jgi:hypothetical protein